MKSKNTKSRECSKCKDNYRVLTEKDNLCYFCMLKVHGKSTNPFIPIKGNKKI